MSWKYVGIDGCREGWFCVVLDEAEGWDCGVAPNDNPQAFDWQSDSWDGATLVVGHLPFMAKLVSPSVVCLELASNAHRHITWMIRPELLRWRKIRK